MRYATVDPANTSVISDRDLTGLTLVDGAFVTIPTFDGPGNRSFTINNGAVSAWHLYDLVTIDPGPPGDPRFYTETRTLTFVGTVGQATARVDETVTYEPIPISTLYDLKVREIGEQDNRVMYNAVDTDLNTDWWFVATRTARHQIATADRGDIRRDANGQGWPGGANQPWLGIYNVVNGNLRRYQISDRATWETLMFELGQHDNQTAKATDDSSDALDAAYGDGSGSPGGPEWQAVAAHDAQDPAWNYPPTVTLPPGARALFGG